MFFVSWFWKYTRTQQYLFTLFIFWKTNTKHIVTVMIINFTSAFTEGFIIFIYILHFKFHCHSSLPLFGFLCREYHPMTSPAFWTGVRSSAAAAPGPFMLRLNFKLHYKDIIMYIVSNIALPNLDLMFSIRILLSSGTNRVAYRFVFRKTRCGFIYNSTYLIKIL